MSEKKYRVERDSLGEIQVPKEALYAAQTQRAVENFPISGLCFPRAFIRALGLIKGAAASVNHSLGLLEEPFAKAIGSAAQEIEEGTYDAHFPVDIFQTGSGTSTNMNVNEVIAALASKTLGQKVHPNDHVNMSQSSNDVIPSAIHVSAALEVIEQLVPALRHLADTISQKADSVDHIVTTGRTHLMDAMPVRLSQQLGGWKTQVTQGIARISDTLSRLSQLAQGGTAVGTGINAPPEFGQRVAQLLAQKTGVDFSAIGDRFERISSQDTAAELSGQLRTLAVGLMKISNDLRWMNSGPNAGLGEIALPALQPGSSIMPGKVNPVIPEAVAMVCAQVMGNDVTIGTAAASGNFQLNVMLPVIGFNLLQSIELLANASRLLADKAIADFSVNEQTILERLERNPIMVTALNPVIGYEQGAKIAKQAYAQGRSVKDVAAEVSSLSREQLDKLLDPKKLTEGGLSDAGR